MPRKTKKYLSKIVAATVCFWLFSAFAVNISAQTTMLAELDFDPRVDGFGFKNYGNVGERWKDDIAADDLIRMFGVKAVCKNNAAKNCVLDAAPREWTERILKAMHIGHCEGISAASLRMMTEMPFKKRKSPAHFQTGAKTPFSLRLDQTLENYFAYYWITQTFEEVKSKAKATAKSGPAAVAKTLAAAMNDGRETYSLTIYKYENGRAVEGHAMTPLAVEDTGAQYKIHLYDNNAPGETRYLFISKTGAQNWSYSSPANAKTTADYFGSKATNTLLLTATSWREGRCFDAPFAEDYTTATGCGIETTQTRTSVFRNASFRSAPNFSDEDGETAEFFLTGEGEILVTDGDGNRVGYDPETNRFYEEIEDAAGTLIGGLGIDLPHYILPYEDTGEPYTIIFSGKNLEEESYLDFVFSAPGFTVGFDGIRLDPNEILLATISHDGQEISFTASGDGETPEVFYSFDSDDGSDASYLTEIEGVQLAALKTLYYDFDFEKGKFYFSDDDGGADEYDIELIRLNADGTEDVFILNDFNAEKGEKHEMDFADWDGDGTMCIKDDDDRDGFADEECSEEENDR